MLDLGKTPIVGGPGRITGAAKGQDVMRSRRWYAIVLCLLFLFLFPVQVLATTCIPLEMRYVLACENGDCSTGFKVAQGFVHWGLYNCDQLPHVLDLDEGEIQDAVACAYNVNADIPSGIVEIKSSDHYYFQDCTEYAQYISVTQLSQESSLARWRGEFEEEAREERVELQMEVVISLAPVVILGVCVPLLFIVRAKDLRTLRARAFTIVIIQGILAGILFCIGMAALGYKWPQMSAVILFLGVCVEGVCALWRRILIM